MKLRTEPVRHQNIITKVEFFARQDGSETILETKDFTAHNRRPVVEGKLYSYAARVPNANSESPWQIGVRATDNRGLSSEALASLVILDAWVEI